MNETETKRKKPKSWPLKVMLLVTVLPIVGAYVAYFTGFGVPEDRVNEGELVAPAKNLKDLLPTAVGEVPEFANNYQWRLLIPVNGQCGELCQQNLYTTRQVHVRLGEKADRVERYAVNIGGAEGAKFVQALAAEHPLLKSFTVDEKEWQQWLQDANVPADINAEPYYLLVDQVGFAMMYYGAQHHGNQLLKDIKRVLRYSPAE